MTEFENLGSDGGEIYNRVFVEGQTAEGERLVVERSSAGLFEVVASPALTNPSFEVDTTGWTTSPGTLTRTTVAGEFDSAPAGGKLVSGGATTTGTTTGTFLRGLTYAVRLQVRALVPGGVGELRFGDLTNNDFVRVSLGVVPTTFTTYEAIWMPKADRTGVEVRLRNITGGTIFFDTVQIARSAATLVDRRSFVRSHTLQVGHRITQASAERIGDLWLEQHSKTPFRGTLKVTGVGAVRRVLGGAAVHPAWLLRETGQLIRFTNMIDPDTGGVGRDGRIVKASYDHNTLTATLEIDNHSSSLDALLAQLAVVVGQ